MQHAAMRQSRAPGAALADPPGVGRRAVFCRPVMQRALLVALVVGTVLNMINQGDALLAGQAVNWIKVGLTYCVPFFVATYGAHCAMRMVPRAAPVGRDEDRSL